jgi:two-component system sensor histidine kinase RegB
VAAPLGFARMPSEPAALTPAVAPSLPPRGGVRLRALVLIRWAAVAGQIITAGVVHWGLGFGLPLLAVGGTIALSALLNLAVSLGRPASTRIDDREATVFLAFDIVQLAVLLYLTGGLTNPFALLLLAPVAIGATILSLASNIALSLLTIGSIALLGILHQPLPWQGSVPALPEIYQTGFWVGLTLTTLLITLYGWRLAEEARQMSDALGAAQNSLAQEQRLSALGALAAAAAHELGSPLSTITVVTKEMLNEVTPDDPLREDVELLASESERCRLILARLTVDPTGDMSDVYTLVPLPSLVEAAAQNYQREGITVKFDSGPQGEGVPTTAPIQLRSPEFMQGIGNIVQNAVSFATHEVDIAIRWTTEWSEVQVSDDGPGFSEALLDELGTPFISTRQGVEGHMGLGVFIAKTLLERTGATVNFGNRGGNRDGAAVVVRWPNPFFKAT